MCPTSNTLISLILLKTVLSTLKLTLCPGEFPDACRYMLLTQHNRAYRNLWVLLIARHPCGTWYRCYRCFLPDLAGFTTFPLRKTQLSTVPTNIIQKQLQLTAANCGPTTMYFKRAYLGHSAGPCRFDGSTKSPSTESRFAFRPSVCRTQTGGYCVAQP